jgi:uncharacterized protein (DUF58 family)
LVVVATAVAVAPDQTTRLFPALTRVTEPIGGVESRLLLAGTAAVVGGLATLLARAGGMQTTTDPAVDGRRSRPVEAVAVPATTITGETLQRRFDQVQNTDELDGVVEQLRSLAVAVERTAAGVEESTARERVATGEWTDDDLTAAVLGESVSTPVVARLRGWLDGDREARRRLQTAVAAIESRLDGDGGGVGEVTNDRGGPTTTDGGVTQHTDKGTAGDGASVSTDWDGPDGSRESDDSDGSKGSREPDDVNGSRGSRESDDSDDPDTSVTLRSADDYRARWRGWLGGTLGLAGLGLLYGSPAVLAGAVVPLAYVTYAAVSALPATVSLRTRRRVLADQITPGDTVTVRLTVENTGRSVLPDLRVVDGVPETLGVVDGSPRAAVSLRPGETATLSYAVTARRGRYEFDDPQVRIRSLAGSSAATLSAPAAGATAVETSPPATTVGVDRAAPLRVGQATADSGGEGLEFHSTREYRSGDPRSRVNWRQFAKRRELVTTQFREERAGRAVVVVDVRPPTRRSGTAATPTGGTYAAYAAEAAVERLRADGDDVSLAVLGIDPTEVSTPVATVGDAVWVGNVADNRQRTRVVFEAASEAASERRSMARDTSVYDRTPAGGTDTAAATLVARCPADAQVILVSPFPDATPAAYARRFRVGGYAVAAVAPDHTGGVGGKGLGRRAAAVGRQLRLRDIRPLCRTVIDWPGDRPLGLAVARAIDGGGRR